MSNESGIFSNQKSCVREYYTAYYGGIVFTGKVELTKKTDGTYDARPSIKVLSPESLKRSRPSINASFLVDTTGLTVSEYKSDKVMTEDDRLVFINAAIRSPKKLVEDKGYTSRLKLYSNKMIERLMTDIEKELLEKNANVKNLKMALGILTSRLSVGSCRKMAENRLNYGRS